MTERLATTDGQRGSALLVVLVMLGLIAALATVIGRSVSGAAFSLSAARAVWQSEADLRAGLELGAATILKLGEDLRSAEASIDLTDRRIVVRVTNERGRIDLNAARAPVLAELLKSKGVLDNDADALAANVIEWRGGPAAQTQLASLQAEGSSPSLSSPGTFSTVSVSGPPQGSAQVGGGRHFLHPWQLVLVPGFSKPLVKAILPLVTVASASDQIDPYIADEWVLKALPGASLGNVDAFLAARDSNSRREGAILLLGVEKKLVTADAASGWRIEISTHMQNGRVRRSEAVIAILPGDSEPYRVLYVLDDQEQPSLLRDEG